MSRFDGSLARTFDFGEAASAGAARGRIRGLASLRLGTDVRVLSTQRMALAPAPDKYKALERRRRAAQIKARHALDLFDVMERAAERSR